MPKITEWFVDSQEPAGPDRVFTDTLLTGFLLRVTGHGKKIFQARGRVDGHRRAVSLGYSPDITAAEARTLALKALADMKRGFDPAAEAKARVKAADAGQMTISALAEQWLASYVRPKLKPRTIIDYERLLTRNILPAVGSLTVTRIERADVVRLHVAMKHIPRRANYAVAVLRSLLNFAIDNGLRAPGTNPARKIKMYREREHERFLNEKEISRAAEAIAAAEQEGKVGVHAAAGLRLVLLTGARSGEITAAEWSHVDWTRRFIRLPDSKNNAPRTIHLSDAAIEVLRSIPRVEPYVVAGGIAGHPFKNLSHAWMTARAYGGLEDVRLHDLRHSYASLAAGRGVSLPMIGKLLGHRDAKSTQRYAHLARDAVTAVNDDLGAAMAAAIARGKPPQADVIKLRRAR